VFVSVQVPLDGTGGVYPSRDCAPLISKIAFEGYGRAQAGSWSGKLNVKVCHSPTAKTR
jgi:hypothetical protein